MINQDLVDTFSILIEKAERIVLLTHKDPDADTLCSAAAIYDVLWRKQKKVTLFNASEEISHDLLQMPYVDKLQKQLPSKIDLAISFDCGSFDRLGVNTIDADLINIDHHISNEMYGNVNIVEPEMASATQVVYTLLKQSEIKISHTAAQLLLTGLMSDTLQFSTDRVTSEVFVIASSLVEKGASVERAKAVLYESNALARVRLTALMLDTLELYANGTIAVSYASQEHFIQSGALKIDTEETIRMMMSMKVVDVAVMVRYETSNKVKVSLRSKSTIDVNVIAQSFGGGGHKKASGFECIGTIEEIKDRLIKIIEREMNAT